MSVSDKTRIFAALAFLFALFVFAGGAFWASHKLWPYALIADAGEQFAFMRRTDFGEKPEWGWPVTREGEGVTVNLEGRPAPGATLIAGAFADGQAVRLLDLDGRVIREWPARFEEIWPDPQHIFPKSHIPTYKFGYGVHGLLADPNGDILVNFEELGMAKLDRCGTVLWTLDRRTHHAVTKAPDGTYWVLANRDVRELDAALVWPPRAPGGLPRRGSSLDPSPPKSFGGDFANYEDLLLHVSADGQVIGEFSILSALIEAAEWSEISQGFNPADRDPTHTNDVEIVTPALAARIAPAKAGDLLINMHNVDMLAVISAESGKMVWRAKGPWVHAHDPDILPDGTISLFDNNDNYWWGAAQHRPGSRIVQFAPDTRAARVVIPSERNDFHFYTRIHGNHQYLPNGDILVVEALAGNVMEFAPDGALVWQYVQKIDEETAAWISEAHRYPPDYFTVTDWACPAG